MGKVGGFLEWERIVPARRAVAERLTDWREVEQHVHDAGETKRQAGRCMDCGVPFCHAGCPLGNPIPEFADLVWRDRWQEAYARLARTNEMPEMTGRLCPAPCEGACVLAIEPGRAVTIEALEKSIADRAFDEGWVAARPVAPRTGKRVAIVGSGPAGLAAAARLNRAGHTAIVYEAAPRAGGLLRDGIPDFKLEKHLVDRRVALLVEEGVEVRCGTRVVDWEKLRAEHDAVVLAIGAMRARELDVPGRELAGVQLAMDYLTGPRGGLRGKRVIILGGGDTGSDCLGTALREGAASVHQIELMPAPPAARAEANAWPAWPMIFRTSSSQEEGGVREFAFRTTHLEGDGGALAALHGVRADTGEALRIPVDALVLALGFLGPAETPLGVALDARGNIATDAQFATSVPGVFCVGDAHRGASLVVWALAEGRDAAVSVDRYLSQSPRA